MTTSANPKLNELLRLSREAYYLQSARSLLWWDQRTMMPEGANEERAGALSTISGLIHDRNTDPKLGKLLQELEGEKSADPVAVAQVREALRGYRQETALPRDLVRDSSEAAVLGQQAWVKARQQSDFSLFKPQLQRLLDLKRREAEYKAKKLSKVDCLYDVLMDEYEPGMTVAKVRPLFEALAPFLTQIIAKVGGAAGAKAPGSKIDTAFERCAGKKVFSKEKQRQLGVEIVRAIGFDFHHGRMDETHHPFCIGTASDTRLTTRYDEDNPLTSVYSMIHEAGHGMYVQGLPHALLGTPAGECRSLGVHESQSLSWEYGVGHSREFCEFFLTKLKAAFPEPFTGISGDDLFAYINRVTPSLIRVDADEVTYVLHIIIRFELEQRLIEGKLKLDDLPRVWNELYEKHLGIRPANDAEGVLQDVHWSTGTIGYFPTYALGAILASQLFAAMLKSMPSVRSDFARGEFSHVLGWLRDKIHRQASLLETEPLLQAATGSGLTIEPFKQHLRGRVQAVYGVSL